MLIYICGNIQQRKIARDSIVVIRSTKSPEIKYRVSCYSGQYEYLHSSHTISIEARAVFC